MDLNEAGVFTLPADYHEFIENSHYCSYIVIEAVSPDINRLAILGVIVKLYD